MKQTLRNLIAEGKTKQVLAQLRQLTQNDADLNAEVVQLSARFSTYEKQRLGNLEDPSVLSIELNKINNALLSVIDDLEGEASNGVTSSHPVTTPTTTKQPFSWTKWTGLNDVKSWIAVFAGIAGILTFYFKYCNPVAESSGKPFTVVVYTHGDGGQQDILKLKDTKLVADFGGRREVATIGANGQNIFTEVPPSFWGKRIGIGLSNTEGYVLTAPDSTYLMTESPIYVGVTLSDKTRHLKGVVKTSAGDGLPDVLVTTVGESVKTDATGYFDLDIPKNKQQETYQLTLTKKGYQTAVEMYIPQSQAAMYQLKKN